MGFKFQLLHGTEGMYIYIVRECLQKSAHCTEGQQFWVNITKFFIALLPPPPLLLSLSLSTLLSLILGSKIHKGLYRV